VCDMTYATIWSLDPIPAPRPAEQDSDPLDLRCVCPIENEFGGSLWLRCQGGPGAARSPRCYPVNGERAR